MSEADGSQPSEQSDTASEIRGQEGRRDGAAPEKDRQDSDAEKRLRAFVAAAATDAGAGCVAVVDHVGRVGARITVIAPSGAFGDVLASSVAAAESICERAGLTVRPWDRETTGLLAPSAEDRIKMGARRR